VTVPGDAGGDGGWIGNWSPGIGDPTVVGWVTVVAYAVAALLCWRAFRRLSSAGAPEEDGSIAGRQLSGGVLLVALLVALAGAKGPLGALSRRDRLRALWLVLAVVLALLGINKQLDVQTAFTEIGRQLVISWDLYEVRRPMQVVFILLIALLGLAAFRVVLRLARGELRRLRLALGGLLFLLCFVVIRAASFHHVDLLIGSDIGGFKMNWLLELGGISLVAVGAYREARNV
jgi:hypothetical protein